MTPSIFGPPTRCTFSSLARSAACGSRQKSRNRSCPTPPHRKSVVYFGAVRLRDRNFVSRLETSKFMDPASCSFSSNSAPPVAEPEHGLWSSTTTPVITTAAFTGRVGNIKPINLPWTSFPVTCPELNPIAQVWKFTRRRCLHNRYFDNLQDVIGADESEFATSTTRNDVLRRLCAIT